MAEHRWDRCPGGEALHNWNQQPIRLDDWFGDQGHHHPVGAKMFLSCMGMVV
jgi:hypothetical protein